MADIMEIEYLDYAGLVIYDQKIKAYSDQKDADALAAAKKYAEELGVNYDQAGTAATKMQELADGQVKTNADAIAQINTDMGKVDDLETTNKELVKAINEVRNAVSAGGTAAAITMEEISTGLAEGILKSYTIKQGENTVGTINIPKDMVVQSGEVVTNPEGQAEGTYIKLTLANATNDVIYVNVGTLVDIYKAKASATQIQIAIDSATREISATIVAGSVGTTELADASVTTIKIADGNVTKAKLSSEVQASLDKADVAESNAKAHAESLNTAMNTRVEALEAIDHDHANMAELEKIADGDVAKWNAAEKNSKDHADNLNTAMNTRVLAVEGALAEGGSVDTDIAAAQAAAVASAAADAKAKADQALADAKAYADSKVAGVDLTGIATNASDIDKLEESLAEGGATANAIADAKKAGTDAQSAVSTLETGKIADLRTDVDALKAVTHVAISADEINALFAIAE